MENIKDHLNETLQEYLTYISNEDLIRKVPTGFSKLDSILNGGLPIGLVGFGAMPGLGKTTFALQMADNMAKNENTKVLFFTLEMTKHELISKALSRISFMNEDLQNHTSDDFLYNKVESMNDYLNQYNSYIDNIIFVDNRYSIQGIDKYITDFCDNNEDCRIVVIIDYLQYVTYGNGSSDKQTTDIIVKCLKEISKRLKITILAISSLNRTNYDRNVEMESFKESGIIEYTCDILLGLGLTNNGDRQQELKRTPRKVSLTLLKGRHALVGMNINYDFYSMYSTFVEK